jgi:glycosyltransferase involved in cell wall biosynthesis
MSVYNGDRHVRPSVQSILSQTFRDFEFIIVDDASEDHTWRILQEFSQKDPRIVLMRNTENIGLTCSLNKGLALASGRYVARQDADDISMSHRLEKQIAYLNSHPRTVLVSSNLEFVDVQGRPLRRSGREGDPDLTAWYLPFYNRVAGHSAVVFRREPVVDLGGYSEGYRYSQDHELWLRLSALGDVEVLPDVLIQWRSHGENISITSREEQEALSLRATKERLGKLAGQDISLAMAESMRAFWLGQIQDSTQLEDVHLCLKQILRAFVKQRARSPVSKAELTARFRRLIARQFIACCGKVNIRKRLLVEVRGLRYALQWHRATGLALCVKEMFVLPFSLIRGLVRSIFCRVGQHGSFHSCLFI